MLNAAIILSALMVSLHAHAQELSPTASQLCDRALVEAVAARVKSLRETVLESLQATAKGPTVCQTLRGVQSQEALLIFTQKIEYKSGTSNLREYETIALSATIPIRRDPGGAMNIDQNVTVRWLQ